MRTQQEVTQQVERYQQALQRTASSLQEAARREDFQELLRLKQEQERLTGGIHALEWALSSDTDDHYLFPWASK